MNRKRSGQTESGVSAFVFGRKLTEDKPIASKPFNGAHAQDITTPLTCAVLGEFWLLVNSPVLN